ncbi:hypothetical protein AMATHDRAFT_62387 [Amanita thiersii Skay4041]|uniref:Uncharacterized protein n=1 Tax=Amanita thiersii Skay4041 TaxID=703135 RepID=A0A2A9NKJ5_9AGAR|nr:hypothetical protein AMATHDRAFT_62387 [Amanita thiersii Skay4041]
MIRRLKIMKKIKVDGCGVRACVRDGVNDDVSGGGLLALVRYAEILYVLSRHIRASCLCFLLLDRPFARSVLGCLVIPSL